jgi:hypothetical protein
VLERLDRLEQAFFWYRYTWLILLVLTVTLDTTILAKEALSHLFLALHYD